MEDGNVSEGGGGVESLAISLEVTRRLLALAIPTRASR